MDEQRRITLVEAYHTRHGIEAPGPTAHAIAHVVVENQIAEGDALPVRERRVSLWPRVWTGMMRSMPLALC